jgi:hypothetical protein
MATDPIVINDGSEDKTYGQISLTGSEAIYRDIATSLVEPSTLRISHQLGTKNTSIDRHLVSFQVIENDDDDAETPYTGSVHVVIAAPRQTVGSAALLKEFNKLSTFVAANWDDLYGGFMP